MGLYGELGLQPGSAGATGSLDGFADAGSPRLWVEGRLPLSPGSAAPVLARCSALQGGCTPVPGRAGAGELPALKVKEKLRKEPLGDEITQKGHGAVTNFTSASSGIPWGC